MEEDLKLEQGRENPIVGGMGVQGPRCGGARRRVSTGREMAQVPGLGLLKTLHVSVSGLSQSEWHL